jgi:hypothetical protein|tara:strand:- start:1186 stop:1497 length:312 start_codon:yes stop_codon:yes gene_type:complete
MNYNEQTTQYMLEKYTADPTRQTVEDLAVELSRSVKSIIGKLSREGVYRREIYKTKTGELPVTKVEIVSDIADDLGIEVESLSGLEKAPKSALKKLKEALEAR